MKILFITSSLNIGGGIQRYNKNLLNSLDKKAGISLVELKSGNLMSKVLFAGKVLVKSLLFRPNIVFCSHINFSSVCYFLKIFFNKEYIIITHGIDVWDIKDIYKIKALKLAKLVISVSNFTADKLESQIQGISRKIFLLPNVVDGKKFYIKGKPKNCIDKYNLENSKVIFTFSSANTENYKGHERVIEALPAIIKKIPNVKFLLLGGRSKDRINELIKKLNLEKYIITVFDYVPFDQLLDFYNLCDVFVMPSKGEGFGIAFLEALACGKPVIAGNVDGSVDAVLRGKTGILVNPNSINEIGNAIVSVLMGKVDKHLIDPVYLRNTTLEAYGMDAFDKKVIELINKLR